VTENEQEFAIFCTETLAEKLGVGGEVVYKMLARDSDLLDTYIVPNYAALHTQGKDYIINDLIALLKKEGLLK
jgi:hypothetical protein